jgi:hypothetical protein
MSTGRFRLQRHSPQVPVTSASLSSPSFDLITFRVHEPPASPRIGSWEYDSNSADYGHRWDSWADFKVWLAKEEREKGIELKLVKTYPGTVAYDNRYRFVCSRKGTGGLKSYNKLRPDWVRKRENKRTNCGCVLIVKRYPGVATVLGQYVDQHDHPLGNDNLLFTRIPTETREYIAAMLRLKVSPDYIVGRYLAISSLSDRSSASACARRRLPSE